LGKEFQDILYWEIVLKLIHVDKLLREVAFKKRSAELKTVEPVRPVTSEIQQDATI
jgi:hypothetical protein